jgi:YVTN family beta-propeller protein
MKHRTEQRAPAFGALLCVVGLAALSAACTAEENAPAGTAYVSNQKGNVTVIDLATFEPISEIDVGAPGPRGIGVTSDGKLLVTANVDGGDLSLIDRETGKLLKRIPIGENPEFVRIRGNRAFVSFEPASLGGPPPKPGSDEAKALAASREEDEEEPARIAVVDLIEGKVIRSIVGGMETEGIEFSADGTKILVTNEADETVTVHDIESGALVKTISTREFGNRPRGIKMAPDGKSYVASIEYGNKLAVLDSEFNVIKSVSTGAVPYGLSFDRDGKRLYVALAKGKVIQVFDTSTYEPIGEVKTGTRCWHFTFTPDDKHILIACGRSDEVVVIDVETLKPVKHITDLKMPWGIVTYPNSVGSLDVP